MENDQLYQGLQKTSVAEYQLFTTPDLYEGKNRNQVIQQLSPLVAVPICSVNGPKLGTKQTTSKVTDKGN